VGYQVVIAEKKSVAADIAAALSDNVQARSGYFDAGSVKVTYCSGHLLENLKPDEIDPRMVSWSLETIPFIPASWPMRPRSAKDERGRDIKKNGKVVLDERIVQQLETIRKLVNGASEVVNGSDADREGQIICDEVLEWMGYTKPVKRLWLQELNPQGIRKAFARLKPNSEYLKLSQSALARSRADYLVGLNATRGYTKLWQTVGNEGMLNVGRVQTPTLWLVWNRENERATFVPVDHFGVKVDLEHTGGSFDGVWVPQERSSFHDDEGRVLSKAVAASVVAKVLGKVGVIESVKTDAKKESQPLPYTLLELQKSASKLGLRPNETLEVVQSLYEKHKLVSYPRTDTPYLPEEDHAQASKVLDSVKVNFDPEWPFAGTVDTSIKSPAWNDAKLGAHYGIIPTVGRKSVTALSPMEKAVYGMIVRRYLAQFMPANEYDATVVMTQVEGERFKSTGRIVRVKGWKVLYESNSSKQTTAATAAKGKVDRPLPALAEGDSVDVAGAELVSKRTEAPPLLDSSLLLDAMKNVHKYVVDEKVKRMLKEVEGLGTEATRANIIADLVGRGYIAEVPKKTGKDVDYVTTAKGRGLLNIVQKQLAAPDLTAWFEGQLEGIREGTTTLERFEAAVGRFVTQFVERIKDPAALQAVPQVDDGESRPCPKCGGRLKIRLTKEKKERFWGCRAYPACSHTEAFVPERDEKKAPKANPKSRGGGGVARPAAKKAARKASVRSPSRR